jgi:hypothetical protein
VLIVTRHASRNVAPKRLSTLDLAMVSSLLTPRLRAGEAGWRTIQSVFVRASRFIPNGSAYPHTRGSGGGPTGSASGAAPTGGGGGAAMYA